jgi:hypothetical protein
MEYVLIWLIFGFLAAAVYRNKNRSALTGFLAGAILGPLGLVLALASSDNMARCPMCAEKVQPKAFVCKHCGHELRKLPTWEDSN